MTSPRGSASAPLVSVILTTCGRPAYLEASLDSALAQTYPNIEVLVCDDAPSAATQAMIRGREHRRVQYYGHQQRLGMARNKLFGFRAATGEYVTNLDDDNLWAPDFVASLITPLEEDPSLVVAFSGHVAIDEKGNVDASATEAIESRYRGNLAPGKHQPFCEIGLVHQSVPVSVSALLRRGAIAWEDFPPGVDTTWDLWVTSRACLTGGGAHYLPERLASYRVHPDSSTAGGGINWHRSGVACFEALLADDRLRPYHGAFRSRCSRAYTDLGLTHLRIGERSRARSCLLSAFRRQPSLRATAALCMTCLPASITRWR